jgi:ribonuclease G
VTLPGRYLVYAPQSRYRAVSRRIADPGERERLRAIVEALPHSSGGFIVRTAGAGASASAFEADVRRLAQTWREIEEAAARQPAPAVLYTDLGLFRRTLRDTAVASVERIVVDEEELLLEGRAYLADLDPAFAARLVRHAGAEPLFDATGVTQDLEKALRPRVWLKSGGRSSWSRPKRW